MKKYNFKKNKFCVIKKAISKELSLFIYNYLLLKEEVLNKLNQEKYISPFEKMCGSIGDRQVPDSGLNLYGDPTNDTLLLKCQDTLEKETGLKLIPTYTYSRNYRKGNELNRHKDRPSCAISATLNIGGDPWPIFIEPDQNKGKIIKNGYVSEYTKGIKIILKPGDMLVYSGCDLEHWREPFEGNKCVQVFLHYTEHKNMDLLYDRRSYLGLPSYFKKCQD